VKIEWVIEVHEADSASLGRLLIFPGIEVCEQGESIWVRGDSKTESLETLLRTLAVKRYTCLPDGQLVLVGETVPSEYLPMADWIALTDWFDISLETTGFAGIPPERASLSLVRSDQEKAPNLLLTNKSEWLAFADIAPQVRLHSLSFAVSDQGSVLIQGSPLPSLPGTYFVEHASVAVMAGWTWQYKLDDSVLRSLFHLQDEEMVLCFPHGSYQKLHQNDFVKATRAAVRMNAQEAVG
jgi:hypothetical protein